jgi:hypothetical protein
MPRTAGECWESRRRVLTDTKAKSLGLWGEFDSFDRNMTALIWRFDGVEKRGRFRREKPRVVKNERLHLNIKNFIIAIK